MKFMKKTITFSLVILLITSLFSVSASALTMYIDDFGYEFNGTTKEAVIVKYIGTDSQVEIPSYVYDYKVTKISDSVFADNNVIEKVSIPDTLNTIGDYVFRNCTSLEEISIPSSVNKFGKGVFSGCASLSKAQINASISSLPQSTFYNCTVLTDVTLSESISEYSSFAFYNCKSIKEMLVPKNVTSINDTAFSGADNVKILCYKDSSAHEFAEGKGVSYVLLRKGDVNLDGRLDISDATAIQLYIAGKSQLSDVKLSLADTTGDGAILISDATEIQKYLVGLTTSSDFGYLS